MSAMRVRDFLSYEIMQFSHYHEPNAECQGKDRDIASFLYLSACIYQYRSAKIN